MTYPKIFSDIRKAYPELAEAYDALGSAAYEAGPLNKQEARLVKLALAIGAGHEGAVHSHTRQALEQGLSPEHIRQTVLLATTTLGFPVMVRAMTWVEDVLASKDISVIG